MLQIAGIYMQAGVRGGRDGKGKEQAGDGFGFSALYSSVIVNSDDTRVWTRQEMRDVL